MLERLFRPGFQISKIHFLIRLFIILHLLCHSLRTTGLCSVNKQLPGVNTVHTIVPHSTFTPYFFPLSTRYAFVLQQNKLSITQNITKINTEPLLKSLNTKTSQYYLSLVNTQENYMQSKSSAAGWKYFYFVTCVCYINCSCVTHLRTTSQCLLRTCVDSCMRILQLQEKERNVSCIYGVKLDIYHANLCTAATPPNVVTSKFQFLT